jgi:hypothetical protein
MLTVKFVNLRGRSERTRKKMQSGPNVVKTQVHSFLNFFEPRKKEETRTLEQLTIGEGKKGDMMLFLFVVSELTNRCFATRESLRETFPSLTNLC